MGQKVKGRYCPRCDASVLGVKNTHRIRNTAAGAMAASGGVVGPLLVSKVEPYLCPNCGGPTEPAPPVEALPRLKDYGRQMSALWRRVVPLCKWLVVPHAGWRLALWPVLLAMGIVVTVLLATAEAAAATWLLVLAPLTVLNIVTGDERRARERAHR